MHRYIAQMDELIKEKSFKHIFELAFTRPQNTAFEWLRDGKPCRLTYAEYREGVFEYAAKLQNAGNAGDWVALRMKNSPEWCMIFWALLMTGRKPVLLAADSETPMIKHVIKMSGATCLITDSKVFGVPGNILYLEDIKASAAGEFAENWADEVAFCSSGTTGDSSLCVFDGPAMVAQSENARIMPDYTTDIMWPDEQGPLKNLAVLPFHHIFGFVAVFLWYTFFNKTLVFPTDIAPQTLFAESRKLGVSHVYYVPVFWNGIANFIERKARTERGVVGRGMRRIVAAADHIADDDFSYGKYRISSGFLRMVKNKVFGDKIRYMISGGGYISPVSLKLVNTLGYPLYVGYGLTEAGITSVELSPEARDRVGASIGIPLYGVEYRLRPIEGFSDGKGELLIRSPQIFKGHLVNGEFVPADLEDGWLATGDVAVETDGRYYIVARIKEIIITDNGENLIPDEIEAEFANIEGIERLAVVGIDTDNTGDEITLVVQFPKGTSRETIREKSKEIGEINAALPLSRMVRRVLIAAGDIPITNTFKVKRRVLKQIIESGAFRSVAIAAGNIDSMNFGFDIPDGMIDELRTIMAEVLSVAVADVKANSHFIFDLNGDSLYYAGLILAIENKYGVSIPSGYYGKCVTPMDFAQVIMYLKEQERAE